MKIVVKMTVWKNLLIFLQKYEAVLEEEPDLKIGVASALKMASMKGKPFSMVSMCPFTLFVEFFELLFSQRRVTI